MDKGMSHQRRKHILSLLVEHGPMSANAIGLCLNPPMERRRLNEVLLRLRSYGWVEPKTQNGLAKNILYYHISQHPLAIQGIARHLEIDASEIRLPFFRKAELYHSDSCALWKEFLKRKFPNVLFIRDHEFYDNRIAKTLLISNGEEKDVTPDMLMLIRRGPTLEPVSVAIEIERNIKSANRIAAKLSKYANETHLDGVIYLCDGAIHHGRIREIYKARVLADALRIKHFGSNFVLFSDSSFQGFETMPVMFNVLGQRMDLKDWAAELLHTPNIERRDQKFKVPAYAG